MTTAVHGLLLLDKACGLSSNHALQQVKRLFRAKGYRLDKIGHTGSLDPLATGLLPLCLGTSTKFAGDLLQADKSYLVEAVFGSISSTGDSEGEITVKVADCALNLSAINKELPKFRGLIAQLPPMYSALKVQGTPLYKLARAGQTIARELRNVHIYSLECLNVEGNKATFIAKVSKGTYIRTLIEDIGLALGVGAYVSALRRTEVSAFTLAQAVDYTTLEQSTDLNAYLLPIDQCLQQYPALTLNPSFIPYLKRGQPVFIPKAPTMGLVRLYDVQEQFVGLGEVLDDGKIGPRRLLANG